MCPSNYGLAQAKRTMDLGSSPQCVIASAITRMRLARPIRLEVNLGNYDDGPSFKPQASSFKQLDIKEIIGYSFKY